MGGRSSARKGANGKLPLAAVLREHGFNIERGGSMSFGEVPDLADWIDLYQRQKTAISGKEAANDPQ